MLSFISFCTYYEMLIVNNECVVYSRGFLPKNSIRQILSVYWLWCEYCEYIWVLWEMLFKCANIANTQNGNISGSGLCGSSGLFRIALSSGNGFWWILKVHQNSSLEPGAVLDSSVPNSFSRIFSPLSKCEIRIDIAGVVWVLHIRKYAGFFSNEPPLGCVLTATSLYYTFFLAWSGMAHKN